MATLQDKVQGYIGTFSDTGSLASWLTQSVHNLVNLLPSSILEKYSDSETDNGSGVSVDNKKILRAHKLGYGAKFVDVSLKSRLTETGSLYKSTNTSPNAYLENGKIYVIPNGGEVITFTIPTLAYSTVAESTQFLKDYEDHIILYVAIRGLTQNINSKIATITSLSFSEESAITYDFSTQIAQIQTYINTEEDFELAQAKINEVNLRLADIKTKMEESGLLISQEDKRLMDTIQKGVQEIGGLNGLLKELHLQYDFLIKSIG